MAQRNTLLNIRRAFLFRSVGYFLTLSFFPVDAMGAVSFIEWYYKIIGRLMPVPRPPPESERTFVGLPVGGRGVPLETALNSRCTSDGDGNPKVFHWGMFDLFHKLRPEDVLYVAEGARVPKMDLGAAEVAVADRELVFWVEKASGPMRQEWLMIVSGMQQQAVCLACAALGAGMVFRNMGKDGTETPDGRIATVKMKIDAMKPSYGESFWTTDAPGAPWLKGNLPEPDRKGRRPLLQVLAGAELEHDGKAPANESALGQVLWAARGRTPHLYKSRHCGMTIPTWTGDQQISMIHLLRGGGLFEYINESKGQPTHAIVPVETAAAGSVAGVQEKFNAGGGLLVFARNEDLGRAFWEVGYQLLNAILQAAALDLSYQAILLDEAQKALIESTGIKAPAVALALS